MYDVMAVAGAVWSYPYAWKGPALVTLGKEISENKWLGERKRNAEQRVCDKMQMPGTNRQSSTGHFQDLSDGV